MATKASRQPKKGPAQRLEESALAFAAEGRWRDLSLGEIAERAKLPIAEAYAVYSSKAALLRGFLRGIDDQVLAGTDSDLAGEPARDRLFDVLMRRFDALQAHKDALATIVQDLAGDPLAGICHLPGFVSSMAAMLEAANLSAEGIRGMARIKGLAVLYLIAAATWFRDDSPDLAKTMARLDGVLRRLDFLLSCCGREGRRSGAVGEKT